MGVRLLLRGVKYLPVMCLALCAMSLPAQSGTYASSAEYQGMLEELHAPAPSPIFIATGTRPLPEQDLKVKVHDTRGRLELKTQSLQITIDRPAATLTMLNLETHASWVFSFAEQAAATPTPVPTATVPPAFTHLTRQQNTWSFSFPSPAGDTTVTLELLHAGMATLSIARPTRNAVAQPLSPFTLPEPTPASASANASTRRPFPIPTSTSVPPTTPANPATTGAT